MLNKKIDKKEIMILMLAGCLLGILCFAWVYGLKIVNPLYDGWMFHGDMDLKQHYVGFCHFRTTPWHFPIGLIDTLSVPYSMSVVYTDSIPLFALVFKIFRNILPVHFQYFGIFGLLSFMMMGMLSPILIRRFCESKIVCILGSLIFILSFPVLQRMYYHTALSAQWIIILALIVWFYIDISDKTNIKKLSILWTIIGVLSVLIHSYFVFMTGIVIAAQITDAIVRSYYARKNGSSEKVSVLKTIGEIKYIFIPLLCMGVFSFATLYILGGFYGKGSVSGFGFGCFNANLSSYINPLSFSSLVKGFDLYGSFEYEGFAYVGTGIFILIVAELINIIFVEYKKRKNINVDIKDLEVLPVQTRWIMAIVVILVLLASCFPSYSFGKLHFFSVPVPRIMEKIFGIFRTNARFVWVGMYLIIISAIWYAGKRIEKSWVKVLLVIVIIIQLFDVHNIAQEKHEKYSQKQTFESVWSELEAYNITRGKKEFVFMYDDSDIMMDTAFYGYLHGLSQNSYYYARTIYDEIDENIAEWTEQFLSGYIDDEVIYVFRDEDYTDDFNNVVKELGAKVYQIEGHVIITK